MMHRDTIIKSATIVNEGRCFVGDVWLKEGIIYKIGAQLSAEYAVNEIDATGLYLLPGVIDDQVHFREPGLTYKADIHSESAAAVAGGVTAFMEMPNTNPATLTQELLEAKYAIAAQTSYANYSFFMGAANDNLDEVLHTNDKINEVCGVKIFMGSSTGNMLVDNEAVLEKLFSECGLLIATHCEDEHTIAHNKIKYADADHARYHPLIRDVDACYRSSSKAIALAKRFNTKLHILHISTAQELALFDHETPLAQKRITAEVCVHHLHFTADDYENLGNQIKCNPAIKSAEHKPALWAGLLDNHLDIIATDHAPHTWEEKCLPYASAPSGVPLVQHSLPLMLSYVNKGQISIEKVVEKMCHAPAILFQMSQRGYIREGFYGDLTLVDLSESVIQHSDLKYKCQWSPFVGTALPKVCKTWVNGQLVFDDGLLVSAPVGQRLLFNRL